MELSPIEYVQIAFEPMVLLMVGIYYFIRTMIREPFLIFQDFQTFRHKAFANFWIDNGEAMSRNLTEGTSELVGSASGVVLDVGPGSGTIMKHFRAENITKVYGIEPAVDLHHALMEAAKEAGLGEGKYEAVAAGAEPASLIPALARMGMLGRTAGPGLAHVGELFDTIVCVRVLCGVKEHKETIETLYHLLKPGGRLLLAEHVVNRGKNGGSLWGKFFQQLYILMGWNLWMGGCHLNKDTETVLRKLCEKEGCRSRKIKRVRPWAPIPHLIAEITK